jgi:hypothetical protein
VALGLPGGGREAPVALGGECFALAALGVSDGEREALVALVGDPAALATLRVPSCERKALVARGEREAPMALGGEREGPGRVLRLLSLRNLQLGTACALLTHAARAPLARATRRERSTATPVGPAANISEIAVISARQISVPRDAQEAVRTPQRLAPWRRLAS